MNFCIIDQNPSSSYSWMAFTEAMFVYPAFMMMFLSLNQVGAQPRGRVLHLGPRLQPWPQGTRARRPLWRAARRRTGRTNRLRPLSSPRSLRTSSKALSSKRAPSRSPCVWVPPYKRYKQGDMVNKPNATRFSRVHACRELSAAKRKPGLLVEVTAPSFCLNKSLIVVRWDSGAVTENRWRKVCVL